LFRSSTNYSAFIGYGGDIGQKIAEDLCSCLPSYGVNALAITPNIPNATPYLDSEENVLRVIGGFDAAIMVCTRGAYSSTRFRHEAEKAIYDLNMPTVAFILRKSPVLEILKRCIRIQFDQGQHLGNCRKLRTQQNQR